MRKVQNAGQSSGTTRALASLVAASWTVSLMAVLGALGCGSPFMGLGAPDDTAPLDAALRDVSVQDAAQTTPDAGHDAFFDRGPDHELKDAAPDGSKAIDGAKGADGQHDGAPDGARRDDAGDGAPPHTIVDGSLTPDARDARDSGTNISTDGKTNDGPFDGSRPDVTMDASIDAGSDGSVDAGSDASIDAGDDAAVADGDVNNVDAHADDGRVCGFAPPAPGGICPAVCNEGCVDGICQIACRGEQECKDATIQCPLGFTCDINCAGKQSCDSAVIVCPATYACRLVCAGEQSCKALQSNCGSGPCEITCLGSSQACDSTIVNCGPDACIASCNSSETPPTLNCGQSCDCRPCP
jgi:hypothetical protein